MPGEIEKLIDLAAMAMQGLVANHLIMASITERYEAGEIEDPYLYLGREAVRTADGLLRAMKEIGPTSMRSEK